MFHNFTFHCWWLFPNTIASKMRKKRRKIEFFSNILASSPIHTDSAILMFYFVLLKGTQFHSTLEFSLHSFLLRLFRESFSFPFFVCVCDCVSERVFVHFAVFICVVVAKEHIFDWIFLPRYDWNEATWAIMRCCFHVHQASGQQFSKNTHIHIHTHTKWKVKHEQWRRRWWRGRRRKRREWDKNEETNWNKLIWVVKMDWKLRD